MTSGMPTYGQDDAVLSLVVTIATIAGNLLADIGYAMLDPRVKYS